MLKFYTGPERRQHCRRQILDRRDLLRWQPEHDERRAIEGRRHRDASKSLA
ncbi:hypothetical protein [Oceanisphaera profunda]|uniref:hypothetical protein n=1 Tax=Oceanisphaera profunda TaxID=1416627 RepID=UPI00146E6248|nr:hypothetical protein [Oceanisphaera profunda]